MKGQRKARPGKRTAEISFAALYAEARQRQHGASVAEFLAPRGWIVLPGPATAESATGKTGRKKGGN
jgi:hypothetical protein